MAKYLRSWEMSLLAENYIDPTLFQDDARQILQAKIQSEAQHFHSIKFQMALKISLVKMGGVTTDAIFRSAQTTVIGQEPIDLHTGFAKMNATLENFTQLGSGWVVVSVDYFWLDIARYQPLHGGSWNYLKV
jgi:hypothetical protein